MATIQATGSKNHHYLTLDVWEDANSTNITNNTTNVSYEFRLSAKTTGYNWSSMRTMHYTITINGVNYTGDLPSTYDGKSNVLVASGYGIPIKHNSDGNKTIDISFNLNDTSSASYTTGNASASGTLALSYIPRASKINDVSVTLNSEVEITWIKYSDFTHELSYTFNEITTSIPVNSNQTSATFTPSYDLAEKIINSASANGTLTLTTKSGTTIIGTSTSTITFIVPDNEITKPNVSISIDEARSGVKDKFGAYIQGESELNVVINVTGYKGATISSYSTIANDEPSKSTSTFKTERLKGSGTVSTIVKDSRGISNSALINYSVLEYSSPFLSVSIERNENIPSDVIVTFKASVYSLNNKNDKVLKVRYREQDAITYSDYITLGSFTLQDGMYVAEGTQTIPNINEDKPFDFEVYLADFFHNITKPLQIGTAFQLMNFNSSGKGIAFGKVSQKDEIEINMNIDMSEATFMYHGQEIGRFNIDMVYPVGALYLSVLPTNPHDLFGGNWEQLKNHFLFATNDTSGEKGNESTISGKNVSGTAITTEQLPSHTHGFTTGGAGGHSHTISGIASRQGGSWNGVVASANTSDRNWSTVSWVGDHTHSGTTNATGSGKTHNHEVPSIEVYVWKRVA